MISERRHRCNFGTAMHIQYLRRKDSFAEDEEYVHNLKNKKSSKKKSKKKNKNNKQKNNNNKDDKKKKVKKIKHSTNTDLHLVRKLAKRESSVLKAANGCCERCGKEIKNIDYLNIYVIEPRDVEEDSVLNMVVLCGKCRNEVNKQEDSEDTKIELKQIAEKMLDRM